MPNIQTNSSDQIARDNSTTEVPQTHEQAAERDAEKEQQSSGQQHSSSARAAAEQGEIGQARAVGASDTFVAHGGREPARRLLLIGLQGATPELAIGAWRTQLRSIELLTERGLRGRMRSSLPWASAPAWQSLLSGQDPGQLGIYGAERRVNTSYAAPAPIDSRAVQAARLWDLLGRAGYSVGVVGAPATTPAPQVNGQLISDQLSGQAAAAYPDSLRQQVALWLADQAPQPASGDEIDKIVGTAYARAEQRFMLARRLLARNSYGCFVLCDDGIATVQNALWHTIDVTHRRYKAHQPFADAIGAFYRFIDEQIGELQQYVDHDTVIAICSAHGAQALDGELALNDWLIEQGELRLFSPPAEPRPLAECEVDWAQTRAWAGDRGAIYLNRAGREPQGIVAASEVEQLLGSLAERLHSLPSPAGAGPVEVYRTDTLYSAAQGVAPELVASCQQPGWRINTLVGHAAVWLSAEQSKLTSACESPDGFFVIYDPRNPGNGQAIEGATVYDLVPSLLALFDQPIPTRLRGRVLSP